MLQLSPKLAAIVAATAAAGFSGAAIAGATDSSSSSTGKQRGAGRGAGETALTGETKAKVEAAALARVKGTVIRTETDNGGVYESHIRRSDGTEVEVKVNRAFAVTAVKEAPARARGGHHGGRGHGMHGDLAAIARTLGVTEAKLRSALEAARPERPANGSRRDRHAEFAAAIAKALGERTADVQAVLEDIHEDGGGRHGHGRGPRPGDESALVSALAERFSVTQAKAQAALDAARRAHEAEHEAREAAMYAAIAKALGKDAAAVEKAFEANRPARPTP